MRHLWHRNVVLLFEVLGDSSTESIGLVMEFCSGGCSMNYDEADRRFISSTTGSVLPEPLAARYWRYCSGAPLPARSVHRSPGHQA